jgi:DNA-directed RNA polymerase specialized sigma24 family protein
MTNITATAKTIIRTQPQRLEEGKDLTKLTKALANAKSPEAQGRAMLAMRQAGASYAQIADVLGVAPMTARARVLRLSQ